MNMPKLDFQNFNKILRTYNLSLIIKKFLIDSLLIISLLVVFFSGNNLVLKAQEISLNEINLAFPVVTQNGVDVQTQEIEENLWVFDGVLKKTDNIRYSWINVDLNTKYATSPAANGGYLEIYKNDDSQEENLITRYGSSPLFLNNIQDSLEPGPNQLLIRYINSSGQVGARVIFRFQFEVDPNQPNIVVVKPQRAVLTKENNYDVTVNLENFALESINSGQENRGQLRLYIDKISNATLIDTFTFSSIINPGLTQLNFNTADLALEQKNIPDKIDNKFIFVLTKTNGEILPYQAQIPVITNYNNTLNVGLPRITFTDPDKNRSDLSVDGFRKFTLQIDNFELLEKFDAGPNEEGKGYLQISIDNRPIEKLHPSLEFSLYELNQQDLNEGPHTVSVQLVNKNFTKLEPEAKDSIEIIFIKNKDEKAASITNTSWRIYAIGAIGVMLFGVVSWFVFKS